jgi:hypothetical protein
MGHKNITMTERYSHLTPDHKKMAIQSMAKVFSNIGKTSKKKAAGKRTKPLS